MAGKRSLPRSEAPVSLRILITLLLSWEGSFMPEPDELAANSMEEEDPFGVELKASLAVSFAI